MHLTNMFISVVEVELELGIQFQFHVHLIFINFFSSYLLYILDFSGQ